MSEFIVSEAPVITEKTIILRKPLTTLQGESIEVLNLREPMVLELVQASKQDTGYENVTKLISMQTAVSQAVLGNMCKRDFTECADFLGGFSSY